MTLEMGLNKDVDLHTVKAYFVEQVQFHLKRLDKQAEDFEVKQSFLTATTLALAKLYQDIALAMAKNPKKTEEEIARIDTLVADSQVLANYHLLLMTLKREIKPIIDEEKPIWAIVPLGKLSDRTLAQEFIRRGKAKKLDDIYVELSPKQIEEREKLRENQEKVLAERSSLPYLHIWTTIPLSPKLHPKTI